jgi:hypothetical protein
MRRILASAGLELLRQRECLAERVARGARRSSGNAGRDRVDHTVTIDGGADASEDRDPKRPAELCTGSEIPAAAPARSGGAVPSRRTSPLSTSSSTMIEGD